MLGQEPIVGITSFGTVDQHRQESNNLFTNYWTAKEFIAPGEGLSNVGGTGWVGGVSQVQEIGGNTPSSLWEQTSLLDNLLKEHLIKDPTPQPPIQLRTGKTPLGEWAIFYPTDLMIDYGTSITQVYKDKKGISAFAYLGNNTYQADHFYPPTNLSLDKEGSTLAGLKSRQLIKE